MIDCFGIYKKNQNFIHSLVYNIYLYIDIVKTDITMIFTKYSDVPSKTTAKVVPHKIDYG